MTKTRASLSASESQVNCIAEYSELQFSAQIQKGKCREEKGDFKKYKSLLDITSLRCLGNNVNKAILANGKTNQ